MAERFVIKNIVDDEYLAEKFLRGYYMTPDISQALKCKTESIAKDKIKTQSVTNESSLTVIEVNFN